MTTNNQTEVPPAAFELTLDQLEAINGGTSNQTVGDSVLHVISTVADAVVKVGTAILKAF